MNIGIYKIVNMIDGKYYVGSSFNIVHRFRTHRCLLLRNKHHCIHLQNAWNKYGDDSFKFIKMEDVLIPSYYTIGEMEERLCSREQWYLDMVLNDSKDNINHDLCYNIRTRADNSLLSTESRTRLSKWVV